MTRTTTVTFLGLLAATLPASLAAQALNLPWSGYGHDSQHTALSQTPSQTLAKLHWKTAVDLNPQFSGNDLFIHYGSPLITPANTILVPVKTGATDGFRIDVLNAATGASKYSLTTDYTLPSHNWIPSFGPVMSLRSRVYWAGAGGTLYYRDNPDSATPGTTGQIAFYGLSTYLASKAQFDSNVKISTPLTADRYGNIFFGFTVSGTNAAGLQSGIARVTYYGIGAWKSASAAAGGASVSKIPLNCAPALSNDHSKVYFAVSGGATGYLVSISAATLAPLSRISLLDPKTGNAGSVSDDATSSPMVGPDGDVYYGILESSFGSNNDRGWMLHFDGNLAGRKIAGAFGWDDTASVVPASLISSYHGSSSYLLLTKYNNYAEFNANPVTAGVNKIAILDPNATQTDAVTGITVMKEVLSVVGPTPDAAFRPAKPNAVREWCINSAVVDPYTRSALVNSEDGKLYRWDFASNTLLETFVLTPGVGEAYTPTLVGVDGTVYAINNATLFAVGQ